jgi:archaellum component FlaC
MGDMPNLDQIKDRAQDVRNDVNALALETVEALRKAVDELTVIASANAADTRDYGQAKLDDFSAAVRRNPLGYLAAGVGLGLVVGLWRQRDIRR